MAVSKWVNDEHPPQISTFLTFHCSPDWNVPVCPEGTPVEVLGETERGWRHAIVQKELPDMENLLVLQGKVATVEKVGFRCSGLFVMFGEIMYLCVVPRSVPRHNVQARYTTGLYVVPILHHYVYLYHALYLIYTTTTARTTTYLFPGGSPARCVPRSGFSELRLPPATR